MSVIKFITRLDFSKAKRPTPGGFLLGYDLDGVLKQKDHLGNVTPVSTSGGESDIDPNALTFTYVYYASDLAGTGLSTTNKQRYMAVFKLNAPLDTTNQSVVLSTVIPHLVDLHPPIFTYTLWCTDPSNEDFTLERTNEDWLGIYSTTISMKPSELLSLEKTSIPWILLNGSSEPITPDDDVYTLYIRSLDNIVKDTSNNGASEPDAKFEDALPLTFEIDKTEYLINDKANYTLDFETNVQFNLDILSNLTNHGFISVSIDPNSPLENTPMEAYYKLVIPKRVLLEGFSFFYHRRGLRDLLHTFTLVTDQVREDFTYSFTFNNGGDEVMVGSAILFNKYGEAINSNTPTKLISLL